MKTIPKIVILGPQGAGKGTQASRISRLLKIPHISPGEELRHQIAIKSAIGRRVAKTINTGALQSDRLINTLIARRLKEPDCRRGWILDGYPRRLMQARALARFGAPNLVVYLHLSDAHAIRRLSGRRVCPHGHIYHLRHDPPRKRRGFCDHDGLRLHIRADDTAAAISRRLRLYHNESEPVLHWYRQNSPVIEINAAPAIPVVYRSIRAKLSSSPWQSSARRQKSKR